MFLKSVKECTFHRRRCDFCQACFSTLLFTVIYFVAGTRRSVQCVILECKLRDAVSRRTCLFSVVDGEGRRSGQASGKQDRGFLGLGAGAGAG